MPLVTILREAGKRHDHIRFTDVGGGWHSSLACTPAGREPASLRCLVGIVRPAILRQGWGRALPLLQILTMGVIGRVAYWGGLRPPFARRSLAPTSSCRPWWQRHASSTPLGGCAAIRRAEPSSHQ